MCQKMSIEKVKLNLQQMSTIKLPEWDILECEVKWALGTITTNKASGGHGIPVELFQILKMMLWKCYNQYVSKSGKLSSGHRTGKSSVSIPVPKKGNVKECSSYHTIVLISRTSKVLLKILQASNTWTMNFHMFKLFLATAEESEINLPISTRSSKKRRVPEKHLFLL